MHLCVPGFIQGRGTPGESNTKDTRIQDKGSRFLLLTNEDQEDKMEHQIARISVKGIMKGTSQKCARKFKLWIKTWQSYKTGSNEIMS